MLNARSPLRGSVSPPPRSLARTCGRDAKTHDLEVQALEKHWKGAVSREVRKRQALEAPLFCGTGLRSRGQHSPSKTLRVKLQRSTRRERRLSRSQQAREVQ